MSYKDKNKSRWARPGFAPGTTRTLSEYHTPRPTSRRPNKLLFELEFILQFGQVIHPNFVEHAEMSAFFINLFILASQRSKFHKSYAVP